MMPDLDLALRYNPFEGDFGSPADRELSDKLVTFRKARPCHNCFGDVKPGTRGRSLTMLWDGDGLMHYAYCAECTQAMAESWTDSGKAICARFGIHRKPR